MLMVTLTVWLSTVAVPLPAPGVLPAVKTEVAVPVLVVVSMGLTVPRVPPKATAVPFGMLNPVPPLEFFVIAAVRVEVPPTLIAVDDAPMLSTSHGLNTTDALSPVTVDAFTVSQPVAPGPALQPHQLSVAVPVPSWVVAPPCSQNPLPAEAVFPTMREFETVVGPVEKIPPPSPFDPSA